MQQKVFQLSPYFLSEVPSRALVPQALRSLAELSGAQWSGSCCGLAPAVGLWGKNREELDL